MTNTLKTQLAFAVIALLLIIIGLASAAVVIIIGLLIRIANKVLREELVSS